MRGTIQSTKFETAARLSMGTIINSSSGCGDVRGRESCFSLVVLCRRGGDRIFGLRCLLVAVGLNACFIVLPHWDNMS